MSGRESSDQETPGHRVDVEANPARVRVVLDGRIVAESRRSLLVRETGLAPVVYFPREDVHPDRLDRTTRVTFCPFKGEASYWTVRSEDREEKNAAWSYENPIDAVSEIAGHVAFYAGRGGLVLESEDE